jgi:hypothetical protein
MLARVSTYPMQVNSPPVCCIPGWLPCLRHLRPAGGSFRTSVRLENAWWLAIDALAEKTGATWQQWVIDALKTKPEQVGVAGWLRLSVLAASGGTGMGGAGGSLPSHRE